MTTQKSLYDIPLIDIDGNPTSLAPYKGQALLIVNVASRCGFTPQYAALETLYQECHDQGVTVLGFPCNQFLNQESGDEETIKLFAQSRYKVSFPMFEKINVRGKNQSPLYAYLSKHLEKKPMLFIPWNFTKILVDPNGRVLRQYAPTASMKTIRAAINKALG